MLLFSTFSATKEVTAKADALMKELLDVVTKNIRANTYLEAGEFLYGN